MKGTVIHHNGRWHRLLPGRSRVKVDVTLPEPLPDVAPPRPRPARPQLYAFFVNGILFAYTSRLELRRGRRYPDIDHWFIH
jgi:hypothetical protein